MWLFSNPKNYPEMIKKIACTMFFVVLILEYVLAYNSEGFSKLLSQFSMGLEFELQGIKIGISYLFIPGILAIIENMFQIHDKISDLLYIRYRFDKNVIIKRTMNLCELSSLFVNVNIKNRKKIMLNIFYKYAGSEDPQISSHLIHMAMGVWSWYWIILDTLFAFFILWTIFLFYEFSIYAILIAVIFVPILLLFLFLIKFFCCIKYAKREVDAIVSTKERKDEITKFLVYEFI